VWLITFDRCGRFLDALAHAQLSERSPCVIQGAMQDLLDLTDALGVQALLSLFGTKMHERITEKLLLLRRHRPSIQCPEYLVCADHFRAVATMMQDVSGRQKMAASCPVSGCASAEQLVKS
jgi:hypothetical protein